MPASVAAPLQPLLLLTSQVWSSIPGQNIVDHPDDAKYQKIRSANGAFSKKIAACNGGEGKAGFDRS